jgi:tetratricopeptide (TPR) repeat protein
MTFAAATLGLAMIMKNEAVNLSRSLAPVAPLVDEMVVVDTGSTDQSIELARALGARVLDFQWTDDFSEARNFGLAAATTDFVFWLDGDNSLSPEGLAELRRHLSPGLKAVLWATEVVTPQGDRLWQKRVWPNLPGLVRWEGRIHEQLTHPPDWPQLATGAEILHWGYAEPVSARQKGERNLSLLLNCPETRAGQFYWLYQTGRTLANLRRYPEAVLWLSRAAEARAANRPLLGHTLILLSQALGRLGRHPEAEEAARRLVQLEPGYGPGHYHLGRLLFEAGQTAEAGQWLESALILGTGDRVWGADQESCNFKAAFLLGRVWAGQGRRGPARQAFGLAGELAPHSPEPPFALAEVALAEGAAGEAKGYLECALKLAPGHRRARDLYAFLSGGQGGNHVRQ